MISIHYVSDPKEADRIYYNICNVIETPLGVDTMYPDEGEDRLCQTMRNNGRRLGMSQSDIENDVNTFRSVFPLPANCDCIMLLYSYSTQTVDVYVILA